MPIVGGADGGAFSCGRDIDRFFRTLVGNETILTPRASMGDGLKMGYGVYRYPDGRFGHGGGDPGVSMLAAHHPDRGVSSIVLGNTEGPVGEVRDLLLDYLAGTA